MLLCIWYFFRRWLFISWDFPYIVVVVVLFRHVVRLHRPKNVYKWLCSHFVIFWLCMDFYTSYSLLCVYINNESPLYSPVFCLHILAFLRSIPFFLLLLEAVSSLYLPLPLRTPPHHHFYMMLLRDFSRFSSFPWVSLGNLTPLFSGPHTIRADRSVSPGSSDRTQTHAHTKAPTTKSKRCINSARRRNSGNRVVLNKKKIITTIQRIVCLHKHII